MDNDNEKTIRHYVLTDEAAVILRQTRDATIKQIRRGDLIAFRVGRKYLIPLSALGLSDDEEAPE
jgi:excisionase family DNA binding protein